MTVRQEILEVARDLTARGLVPFSPQQVIDELRRRGTTYQESSIRTHVVDFMCIDAPTKYGVSYPDLRRVSRGQYVLASEAGASVAGRPHRSDRSDDSPVTRRTAIASELRGRPWSWEGNVQQLFTDYLTAEGWEIISTADTASRESGPDGSRPAAGVTTTPGAVPAGDVRRRLRHRLGARVRGAPSCSG
jgi:hypothetical protein